MRDYGEFYIGGRWVKPAGTQRLPVINPATETVAGHILLGTEEDVDAAVAAARHAFPAFSRTSREERMDLLRRVIEEYRRRQADVAAAITEEMGAPARLASDVHVMLGLQHLSIALEVLEDYPFEESLGTSAVFKEPIGVCAFITPWNWPINQIACKVAPALAVGCTMVLKPSEIAPFSAQVWAEILDKAGVPAGVFNLVQGDGPTVGAALSRHPDVDMVSFTGSTRAGIQVAQNAAPTVKRVHQELGGKSANILLPDADIPEAVAEGVRLMMLNSGQSCNAPSRMLVPRDRMAQAREAAAAAAAEITVGDPAGDVAIGPVVSERQWRSIQAFIQTGIDEGATLIAGGPGKPDGLNQGFYVRPTIFADVRPDMTIAREEIFGPVLVMIEYADEKDAVRIANDSVYGLAAYVQGGTLSSAHRVIRQLRAGQIFLNYAALDLRAPFGGYKQSGNGREWGKHAFGEFLETKAVMGFLREG